MTLFLLVSSSPCHSSRIVVGDGSSFAVTHAGTSHISTSADPLTLRHVLVSPNLIKNLVSVKKLSRDNPVNVEFDDHGLFYKDQRMKVVTLRCDSPDDLYPLEPTTEPQRHHTRTAASPARSAPSAASPSPSPAPRHPRPAAHQRRLAFPPSSPTGTSPSSLEIPIQSNEG